VEHYAERNFKRFLVSNGNSPDASTFLPTLPEPFETELKNTVFAIPIQVEREIRYFTRTAKEVWEEERPLPQELNDITLECALVSANIAFNILSAFMEIKTDKSDAIIKSHAMLYEFWNGQVNSGLVKRQAGFHVLQERINSDTLSTDEKKKLLDFSDAVNSYEKNRQQVFMSFVKKEEPQNAPLPNASATQHVIEG